MLKTDDFLTSGNASAPDWIIVYLGYHIWLSPDDFIPAWQPLHYEIGKVRTERYNGLLKLQFICGQFKAKVISKKLYSTKLLIDKHFTYCFFLIIFLDMLNKISKKI